MSRLGLLVMGGGQPNRLFGDGRICVGSGGVGLWRFPVRSTDSGGGFVESGLVAHSRANFGGTGVISAGSTWHFQVWFRDPAGPPCGTDSTPSPGPWSAGPVRVPEGNNLANALSATYLPRLSPACFDRHSPDSTVSGRRAAEPDLRP